MIRSTIDSSVATITLARSEKKNALTPAMLAELNAAIRAIDPAATALLLCGEGDAFCAGFDLSLCRDNSDALRDLLTGLSTSIAALRALPIPVVMAVHGAAIAGGCALLGGADVVISHADCKLGYPVVKLGISPAVSMPFLVPAVGPAAARARALDTSLITGTEAHRIGLVHECAAAAGDVLPRARRLAQDLGAKPTSAMRATKSWMGELDSTGASTSAAKGLKASLGLVGSIEERTRMAELWKR